MAERAIQEITDTVSGDRQGSPMALAGFPGQALLASEAGA